MAGTISMAGLVSSNDWTKLVTDMINAQKIAAETPYTDSKTKYQTKLSAYQAFNLTLTSIVDYIKNNTLDEDDGYALYTSSLSSSDPTITPSNVLNASVGSANGPGTYSVEVTALAQAQKIASDTFAAKTDPLHLTGDIFINDKKLAIGDSDSLIEIAGKINDAGAGVVATVLSISGTEFKLMLESAQTGAEGISLKNGSSTDILESLNLHTSTTQLSHASGLDALSDTYTDKASPIGTVLGLTTAESGTIQIQGTDTNWKTVNINLGTDSLQTIADNINLAAPVGVAASVETVTESGSTRYRLRLTNVDATKLLDQKNILETLGVVSNTVKNSLRKSVV